MSYRALSLKVNFNANLLSQKPYGNLRCGTNYACKLENKVGCFETIKTSVLVTKCKLIVNLFINNSFGIDLRRFTELESEV